MTWFPLVERELRVASRRASNYWVRCSAASLGLAVLIAFVAIDNDASGPSGSSAFQVVSTAVFVVSGLTGALFTSDVLSSEKRQETLGLLLLTDLRGWHIVLGKLAASSVHAVLGLVAVAPVLAVPLMLGGVSGREFLRVVLALFVSTGFSLTMGVLVSALARELRQVVLISFSAQLTILGLLPLVSVILIDSVSERYSYLRLASPTGAFVLAFDDNTKLFWVSVGIVFGLSALFLILACHYMESSLREARPAHGSWRRNLSHWMRCVSTRCFPANTMVGSRPFFWLGMRGSTSRMLAWVAVLLTLPMVAAFIGGVFKINNWEALSLVGFALALFGHVLLKYLVAYESCGPLCDSRLNGELELVLTTPVKEDKILRDLRASVAAKFNRPMGCLMLGNMIVCVIIATFWRALNFDEDQTYFFAIWIGSAAGMVLLDFWALRWLGQWRALRARNTNRALATALGWVFLPSWAGFFLMCFAIIIRDSDQVRPMIIWAIASAIVSLALGSYARSKVSHGMRWALAK